MQITVNGQSREVPDGMTVAELIAGLSLQPVRVAVERNKELVPRAIHDQTRLSDRDKLEIVTLVGGG